jgi:hypothetical protein
MTENNNENTILNKIHNTSNELFILLNKIKAVKTEIKRNIGTLDNNYFVEKTDAFNKFNELIDDEGINQLTYLLDKLCKDVSKELDTKCSDHEFIDDSTDIGLDQTINFCYCKKCHLSKKQ